MKNKHYNACPSLEVNNIHLVIINVKTINFMNCDTT